MSAYLHRVSSTSCALMLILACPAAGCTSSNTPSAPAALPSSTGSATITIKKLRSIPPPDMTMITGAVITWVNRDGIPHTIVSDAGSSHKNHSYRVLPLPSCVPGRIIRLSSLNSPLNGRNGQCTVSSMGISVPPRACSYRQAVCTPRVQKNECPITISFAAGHGSPIPVRSKSIPRK